MNQSLFSLIKIRNAERSVRLHEQNLPPVTDRLDNKGVLDNSFHTHESNTKLNECKR
jgi:hypothetical protein